MIIAVRLKLCSIWDVLYVHDGANGLGSYWYADACYELTLFYNLWTWLKIVETWNLFTAGIGTSMCRTYWDPWCYHLYARLLCLMLLVTHLLGQLGDFCAKTWEQAKWWEKIKMGMYCPMSRYRDDFQLHIWMNLSLVVDAKTIVLIFWLSMT